MFYNNNNNNIGLIYHIRHGVIFVSHKPIEPNSNQCPLILYYNNHSVQIILLYVTNYKTLILNIVIFM